MSSFFSVPRKIVLSVGLLSLSCTLAHPAHAQQNNAVAGGLTGFVTDTTGAAIPGATVVLVGPQQTITVTTDSKGRYEQRGLTVGLYKITVTAPGFTTFVSTGNEVVIEKTSTLNAQLAIGKADTTVEVSGGATQIDTENTSVNTQLSSTFLEQLPLPRNVSGSFYVAPGVVSGGGTGTANPSIGGSSGLENNYSADGVTITDQAYGGLGVYTQQYGSLGTGINLAFIQEVDIKTVAFEPKYGQGDGGIVEIVTKSGSNNYHGSVAAYILPEFASSNRKQLYQYGYQVTTPSQLVSSPQYEGAAQFGGYIKKDKLFFFGAFDPTLNRNLYVASAAANATAFYALGSRYLSTTSLNYAGKLTYTPFAQTIVEFSTYGDPSKRNAGPESFSTTNFPSVSDSYKYGTRNSIARVNTQLYKALNGFLAYSYSTEHYTDSPLLLNTYAISDRTASTFIPNGFGQYNTTKDANYTLQGDLNATGQLFGKHSVQVGYLYNHVNFSNATLRTGPNFAIPTANAAGTPLSSLYTNIPAGALGKPTNAIFYLQAAETTNTGGCTYCAAYTSPADGVTRQVYLREYRGTYAGSIVNASSRYKVAYGNEVYSPNRFVTVNAGVRWEQQTYGGSLLTYNWRDNWSPRLGITFDPIGDRKNKIFFNYSRYQNPLPLDAAIRQLGNEQDDTAFYFAPQKDSTGKAVLDSSGAVLPNLTAALNGTQRTASGVKFAAPNFGSSTGEGILPGTKMEYLNEYVLGIEHEIKPGVVLKVRYIDRQFGRIVEDNGSQSPEGAYVDANYAGGIANITAASDFFNNETEVTYTPAQFLAANAGRNPGQVTSANYRAPVAGCTYGNDTTVANGGFFTQPGLTATAAGTTFNGACVTNAATTAGVYGADGIPDGFADPRRVYRAMEFELNRSYRNHWQARINYKYSNLYGNYEGFYRNDNGQSDPGISSLFDFTQGAIGLLGDQFRRGFLPTDRHHVANALVAYTFGSGEHFFGKLNGLTVGTYIHGLSGTPLSAFSSHPVYLNAGEIPIGGRGTRGFTPVNVYADANVSDTFRFKDRYAVRAAFDAFNITDSQATINRVQNIDTSFGSAFNTDFNRPNGFVSAFRGRFTLALDF